MLYHRARLVILGHRAPISRLTLDFIGITELDKAGPNALLMALPELTPPAREIVMLTVRLFGERLFSRPPSQLLKGYAFAGPIAAAETMLLMDHPGRGLTLYDELMDGFESIFARRPQVFLARSRRMLTSFTMPIKRG